MAYPTPPNPGTVVPSGSLVTPSGTMGAQGPTGPTGVSANTGNLATLGSDNLVLVPQNAIQGMSKYFGSGVGNNAITVTVNSDFQLVTGVIVWVVPAGANGNSPTLNVNGTGAIPLVNRASIALWNNSFWLGKMFGAMYDGSSWRVITPLILYYGASNPGTVTIECGGYDAVNIYTAATTAAAIILTLAHIGVGMPVVFQVGNNYSSAITWQLNATNSTGTTIPVYWIWNNSLTVVTTPIRIDSTNPQSAPVNMSVLMVGGCAGNGVTLL